MPAEGRYCLNVCYCRECPQHADQTPSDRERRLLLDYLAHPPRKYTPAWWRDPLGRR